MQKRFSKWLLLIPGTVCGTLAALLSCALIRRLDAVLHWGGSAMGLTARKTAEVVQVLAQLRQADVRPAWLPLLAVGAAAGALLMKLRRRTAAIFLWLVLWVMLMAASLWLMEVNGVQVGALISCLLPMLRHL